MRRESQKKKKKIEREGGGVCCLELEIGESRSRQKRVRLGGVRTHEPEGRGIGYTAASAGLGVRSLCPAPKGLILKSRAFDHSATSLQHVPCLEICVLILLRRIAGKFEPRCSFIQPCSLEWRSTLHTLRMHPGREKGEVKQESMCIDDASDARDAVQK